MTRTTTPIRCHGSGGDGRGELGGWMPLADQHNFIVACPTAGMWGGGDVDRLRVEEQAAVSMVQLLKTRYSIDASRVMATGFSRGGPPAGFMALLHPDVFNVLCLRSTLFSRHLITLAETDPTAKAAVQRFASEGRVYMLCGKKDAAPVLAAFPKNMEWFDAFRPAHFRNELVEGMGHSPAYPLAAKWFAEPTTKPATRPAAAE